MNVTEKRVGVMNFRAKNDVGKLRLSMKVSYNKLWKLLIDCNVSKSDLRKAINIAPNTMTKMNKDEPVSMIVLLKIAEYLQCDISDICEFIKNS